MTDVRCTHCDLPVPAGLIDPDADEQFCCNGCRMVYEAIHGCGLQRFYELKDEADPKQRATTTGKGYEPFDDPAFAKLYVKQPQPGIKSIELYLEGVHCAACVWLVERLPYVLDGVLEARLDIGRRLAHIVWNDDRVTLSHIARTLDSLGYPPHPYRASAMREARQREARKHLIRIGVSFACAGNVMLIAFALYGGMFTGIEEQYRRFLQLVSLGLTVVAVLWPGRVFFVGSLSSLRTRVMHMDVPVALALTLGTVWGAINTFRGPEGGEVYFDSITVVILLLLVGRWIQHRQERAAHDAIELLYTLTPATARRIDSDGTVREAPVEALIAGDRCELRAGDSVPADGVLVDGTSEFDTALLTGESRPVTILAGERVHAGTVNTGSRAVMEVRAVGADTRVGRLMQMVEQFAHERPPIVRLADRVAHWFVITVLTLAAGTVVLWLMIDPSQAVEQAITLLIVTCPCALGLATPLAIDAAIGRAARGGILIKGGAALEQLARPGVLVLDKTGTLTEGTMRLIEWRGDDSVRPAIVAIERQVAHPIARAFIDAFVDTGSDLRSVAARQLLGGGVLGEVDGESIIIGSPAFVRERTDRVPDWARTAEGDYLDRALTPVLAARCGEVVGVAGFGDPVLDDAAESIKALRSMSWRPRILSGDHPAVVDAVGDSIGIDKDDREGGASPEHKAEVVRAMTRDTQPVVMVGDGVNDAAALSAASVGLAVHGGAEVSLATADVYMSRPGLRPVVELMRGARRTLGTIRLNLGLSLAYNAVTATLAIAGLINPVIAAVLMPLSSLTVVTVSARARTFES
jgi:Cu2+-exporting ATPase